MWRSPEPSPGSGGPPGLRAPHAAWRRWWQPQKPRLDHPGDVHFGLLKPISFIPWLRNGQNWPKGPYPNQKKIKKKSINQILLYPQDNLSPVLCHAPVKVDSHLSGRPGPYGHSGPDIGQLAGTAKVEHPGPPGDFPAHPACGHCR